MADISEKTRREMEAGAHALALADGRANLPPGYLEAIVRTHSRYRQLRIWEGEGKLMIEKTSRISVPVDERPKTVWHTLYHVKYSGGGGDTFTDIDAEQVGASPSEVLIAHLALALQAHGDL